MEKKQVRSAIDVHSLFFVLFRTGNSKKKKNTISINIADHKMDQPRKETCIEISERGVLDLQNKGQRDGWMDGWAMSVVYKGLKSCPLAYSIPMTKRYSCVYVRDPFFFVLVDCLVDKDPDPYSER